MFHFQPCAGLHTSEMEWWGVKLGMGMGMVSVVRGGVRVCFCVLVCVCTKESECHGGGGGGSVHAPCFELGAHGGAIASPRKLHESGDVDPFLQWHGVAWCGVV